MGHLPVIAQQRVGCVDVAVDDVFAVDVRDGIKHLVRDGLHLQFGEPSGHLIQNIRHRTAYVAPQRTRYVAEKNHVSALPPPTLGPAVLQKQPEPRDDPSNSSKSQQKKRSKDATSLYSAAPTAADFE
jgi:hypothetical protein